MLLLCRLVPPRASLLPTEGVHDCCASAVVCDHHSLPSINATALLMGCAKRLEPQVRQQCWEAVVSPEAVQSDPRGVPNAAWALAVLEVRCRAELCRKSDNSRASRPVPVWKSWLEGSALYLLCLIFSPSRPQDFTLAECEELARLMGSIPAPEPVALRMWHQAHLLFKAQFPELACPPELLERSWAAYQEATLQDRVSTLLQHAVAQAARRVAPGQRVELGYVAEAPGGEGCLRVEVALPALRIALEADGPAQFLRNVPQRLRGEAAARNRLLRAWGWRVVSMSYAAAEDAYGSLSGDQEELVQRLVSYLQQHTDLPCWLSEAAGRAAACRSSVFCGGSGLLPSILDCPPWDGAAKAPVI